MGQILGTVHWEGVFNGAPAIVVTYHDGAALWVFENNEWRKVAQGILAASVVPHTCEKCGTSLPVQSVSK